MGKGVFSDDDALTSIVLPSTLKEIGDSAFEDSGIVGVYIPENVTSMGNRVFQDIPSGSIIYMDNNTLLTIVNTTTSDWNKKYNTTNTALAVTNSGSFAKGTTFTANNLATPTKEGYTFGGWYTDSEFTSETVISAAAGQTYYAKWVSAITFDGNGATGGTMSIQEILEGDTAVLTANGFTRTGYTFDRWNTAADGSGDNYADQTSAPVLWAAANGVSGTTSRTGLTRHLIGRSRCR